MLAFKYLLMTMGVALLIAGVLLLAYDLWLMLQYRRALAVGAKA